MSWMACGNDACFAGPTFPSSYVRRFCWLSKKDDVSYKHMRTNCSRQNGVHGFLGIWDCSHSSCSYVGQVFEPSY
jgi:hypothetical protein